MGQDRKGTAHGTPVTVAVERLAGGGDGVGHIAGKAVFVPLSAPGDVVAAEIVEDRRSFCRARLQKIVVPSPDRVEPPCPLFGACGGCAWQHLAYPAQLAAKRAVVEDALRRIGRLAPPPVPPVVPSPRQYGYRHRAQWHAVGRGGATTLGFFQGGSHRVVPCENCPVLHPALNVVLGLLAVALRRSGEGLGRSTDVRADTGWDGGTVRLTFGASGSALPIAAPLERALRDAGDAAGIVIDIGVPGRPFIPLRLGPEEKALVTTGPTFTQVNLAQNEVLVAATLDLAAVIPGEQVLDLCCGLGNLAVPAAARGAEVLGIDLDQEAVRQARENARRRGCNARFVGGDAAAAAAALAAERRRFDLVLLNPPRGGARDACAALPGLAPERIVIVSCDPATLARDAAVLAAGGYRLAAALALDVFPQTAHVETVARFERVS